MQPQYRNVQRQDSFEPCIIAQFFCHAQTYLGQTRQDNWEQGEDSVKELSAATEIIRRAKEALRRGDMGAAVAAKKALAHTIIRMGGHTAREHLVQQHNEIHGSIGALTKKAGSLN